MQNNAKAKTAAALPLKPAVSQPITATVSKLTSAPRELNYKKKKSIINDGVILNIFLALVASMTIKPTIMVNGPRPTVAAVAAGNSNYLNSLRFLYLKQN